ncbi:cell cycle checkpoint protein RAD1-like [Portunus trituberculatus]|uniref:cell cycle checkpoint protein RAD1-like n=1 Tax=Portunus trituberculatus TaxID=210409 RepID=UPI001E1CC6EE|nr:cell cycle checkpoint protein RAD1-like [Portunus trituberculatus]
MSIYRQEEREINDGQFRAKTDNVKNILQILKTMNFRDQANVVLSPSGIKVTVENVKCAQANAFIETDLFQEYEIEEEMVIFKLNLTSWIECLNIFGGGSAGAASPSLKMVYRGHGYPLVLELEEDGVVTDCEIKTEEPEDTLDFDFFSTGVMNKIIMRSECLKEVFTDLDVTSEMMEILMSPDAPYFRVSTFGNYGTSQTEISMESELVEHFECKQTLKQRYRMSLIKPSIKPLTAALKVSVRMDARGFLCLQFMIRTESHHICFIEYFCCPEEEDGDD